MTIPDPISNALGLAMLALTPTERWSAARRLSPHILSEYGSILIIGLVLFVLVVLLWWVSAGRKVQAAGPRHDVFAEYATRRGLGARERQVLLAITARSGLRRRHDIFSRAEAYDRGAAKLLAECARSRTPEDRERLDTEVNHLRQKLGYLAVVPEEAHPPTTRDLAVGTTVELVRRQGGEDTSIRAEVIHSDDRTFTVELDGPAQAQAGEIWRVQCSVGTSIHHFDVSAVRCDGRGLVLTHSDRIAPKDSGSRQCMTIHAPAVVARFPFIRSAATGAAEITPEVVCAERLELVEAVVTEVAGPVLQIRTSLGIRVGDRIMVAFKLPQIVPPTERWHLIEHVGQVTRRQTTTDGMAIAVELIGLGGAEIDELMCLAGGAGSCVGDRQESGGEPVTVTSAHAVQGT